MLLKRLCMINWLNKFNAIQTNVTSYLVKKDDYDTKIEQKIPDHAKHINTN